MVRALPACSGNRAPHRKTSISLSSWPGRFWPGSIPPLAGVPPAVPAAARRPQDQPVDHVLPDALALCWTPADAAADVHCAPRPCCSVICPPRPPEPRRLPAADAVWKPLELVFAPFALPPWRRCWRVTATPLAARVVDVPASSSGCLAECSPRPWSASSASAAARACCHHACCQPSLFCRRAACWASCWACQPARSVGLWPPVCPGCLSLALLSRLSALLGSLLTSH